MTNEEKAKELGQKYFPNEYNIWARPNYEAQYVESACLEITEWKEQQMMNMFRGFLNSIGRGQQFGQFERMFKEQSS